MSAKVDTQIGNIEHIGNVDVLQVGTNRIGGLVGQDTIYTQMAVFVAHIEIVYIDASRVGQDFTGLNLPKRIANNKMPR